MSDLILNIVHRPEMAPEYAENAVAQAGDREAARRAITAESLDIFRTQQRLAHENGLKTTIQMTYASLFNDEAVALAKQDHETWGDEIGLTFIGLPCREFREKYQTDDFCIWMFSMEDKKAIVRDCFEKFHERFGFYPVSTGSYYMDAELLNYVKACYPSVRCAVATCWEEGPKAYHTCNNSWYTFLDGGPWAPWIPSKANTHAPAADETEDCGVVAIPHLSRDLIACYDGNGSNFGTHPQNVLRGMIYRDGQYPYLYNLIDQYRYQARFNDGFAYNMMFVGPGWMNKAGRWEAPYELLYKSYADCCAYYGGLKKAGKLRDMTMGEFADFYRAQKTYTAPECALWRDILYGSKKQVFWYCDPYMRACVNMDQGGALVDLRPYAAKLRRPVGIGTAHVQDASYPFLIQEKYRAGYFTHYAGKGTVKSAKLRYGGAEADLCLCRTKAHFSRKGGCRRLTLDPVELALAGLSVTLQTVVTFEEGSGRIRYDRTVLKLSDPDAQVAIDDYMVACYGTTEYAEDMTPLTLLLTRGDRRETLRYAYKGRRRELPEADCAACTLPPVGTRVSVTCEGREKTGYFTEGYAFSPMFTLGYTGMLREKETFTTWLKLEKAE